MQTEPLRTPRKTYTKYLKIFGLSICTLASCSDDTAVSSDGGPRAADASAQDASGASDASAHGIGPLGPGLSTLAGDSNAGFVDGARVSSLFSNPVNVAVRSNGNIYVADFDNGAVRVLTPAGATTTLVKQANFSRPFGMVFTPSDELFVQTDRNSHGDPLGALWKIALDTGSATLVLDDIGRTRGLASLSDGRIVLADSAASTLRIYDPVSQALSNLAGQSNAAGFADGIGAAARFDRPMDLVVTTSDEIYVADSANHRIRHVTLAGVVTTLAGNGVRASVDGPLAAASFDTPIGLATDLNANLYVSEFDSGRIRRVDNAGVETIAGSVQGFGDDEDPLLAQLYTCEGLDFDASYLYIADGNGGTSAAHHRVRRLDLSK